MFYVDNPATNFSQLFLGLYEASFLADLQWPRLCMEWGMTISGTFHCKELSLQGLWKKETKKLYYLIDIDPAKEGVGRLLFLQRNAVLRVKLQVWGDGN